MLRSEAAGLPAVPPPAGATVRIGLAFPSFDANGYRVGDMAGRVSTLGLGIAVALACAAPAHSQEVWTGVVKQNSGPSDLAFTIVMRLSDDGGETEYPELKCSGKL